MSQKIYIIAGATASGKTARALLLAEQTDAVIINADSQQVYGDLRILTARPTAEEESRAPHKLYGILPASEHCTAGKWLRLAKMEIDWALAEGKTPILVGGTGLYLKALMQGIAEIPEIDISVRTQSQNDYDQMGKDAFAERLRHVDPEFFVRLPVQDKQRLVRAYAVWLGSGKPLSFWQQQATAPAYAPTQFQLEIVELPRAELYARCDARVLKMLEEGALEEVRSLPAGALEKIIGVRELRAYLAGEISLESSVAAMQQATRHYAKRQNTWFRNQFKAVDRPSV